MVGNTRLGCLDPNDHIAPLTAHTFVSRQGIRRGTERRFQRLSLYTLRVDATDGHGIAKTCGHHTCVCLPGFHIRLGSLLGRLGCPLVGQGGTNETRHLIKRLYPCRHHLINPYNNQRIRRNLDDARVLLLCHQGRRKQRATYPDVIKDGRIGTGCCSGTLHLLFRQKTILRNAICLADFQTQTLGSRLKAGGIVVRQITQTRRQISESFGPHLTTHFSLHLGTRLLERFATLGLDLGRKENVIAVGPFNNTGHLIGDKRKNGRLELCRQATTRNPSQPTTVFRTADVLRFGFCQLGKAGRIIFELVSQCLSPFTCRAAICLRCTLRRINKNMVQKHTPRQNITRLVLLVVRL